MATVAETLETLKKLTYEKTILEHVIAYLDETFLTPSLSPSSEMVLLTEDRVRVPGEEIELFAERLMEMQKINKTAIDDLLGQHITKQKDK